MRIGIAIVLIIAAVAAAMFLFGHYGSEPKD
jgi:hypothetical protein